MKALLIEDENFAVHQVKSLLEETAPDFTIVEVLDSIESTIEWFDQHEPPDLVFMDVHLADGSCFEIFIKYKKFKIPGSKFQIRVFAVFMEFGFWILEFKLI